MAKLSAEITEGDEESDIASFLMDICGLDYIDVMRDSRILTREIWEKNFEKILDLVKERFFSRISYLIFGYFTLFVGADLPSYLRPAILDAADWKHEENRWGDDDFILERKFYLDDFQKKIRNYKPGKPVHLVKLKNFEDALKYGAVGLDQFWEYVNSKKIFSVKHVNLDSCDLDEIPEPIYDIEKLKTLSLEHNQIKEISEEIGKLTSLEKFYLTDNQITRFPLSIGKLSFLKILDLKKNKLAELPDSIGDLHSLERLFLNDNLLENLPNSILKMKSLKSIYLTNNKIKKIPKFLRKAQFYIEIEPR